MARALVLGVNGQDGSYVAEALLERGYAVTGAGRQPESRHVAPSPRFSYVPLDLRRREALRALLEDAPPDLVFHAAAIHGASGFQYEPVWDDMMAVNVLSVHTVLEFARTRARALRLVYASSSKVFPGPLAGRIDERTPIAPSCLYSIGKVAALELIRRYRRAHGIAAANLFLFNHESPRRPPEYFVPTIARCVAAARRDPATRIEVRTLGFRADWSSAEELMDIAVDVAERAPDDDFVLASGTTWLGREAVRQAFARHGLDAARHVVESAPDADPGPAFSVALEHLERRIGRRPARGLLDVVDEIVAGAG